jgi:hypothetical protein
MGDAIKKRACHISSDVRVLACRAMAPELERLGVAPERTQLLDQGLHRYPQDLHEALVRSLEELESDAGVGRVVVVYGLCGGAAEGLCSRRAQLTMPLVHDCIPLLLGRTLDAPAVEKGGTFYLSPGWIDHGQTPFTEFFRTRERFGLEDAMWIAKEMLKGYTEVMLIETLAGLTRSHRQYALEMSRLFDLAYRETRGDSRFLEDLLFGRRRPDILYLKPGESVTADRFRAPK